MDGSDDHGALVMLVLVLVISGPPLSVGQPGNKISYSVASYKLQISKSIS